MRKACAERMSTGPIERADPCMKITSSALTALHRVYTWQVADERVPGVWEPMMAHVAHLDEIS